MANNEAAYGYRQQTFLAVDKQRMCEENLFFFCGAGDRTTLLEEGPSLHPVCELSKESQCIWIIVRITVIVNMETMVTSDVVHLRKSILCSGVRVNM